ncbi:Fc.00g056360.m01.CDS01 [Cosmosporella sp. VM-42]
MDNQDHTALQGPFFADSSSSPPPVETTKTSETSSSAYNQPLMDMTCDPRVLDVGALSDLRDEIEPANLAQTSNMGAGANQPVSVVNAMDALLENICAVPTDPHIGYGFQQSTEHSRIKSRLCSLEESNRIVQAKLSEIEQFSILQRLSNLEQQQREILDRLNDLLTWRPGVNRNVAELGSMITVVFKLFDDHRPVCPTLGKVPG